MAKDFKLAQGPPPTNLTELRRKLVETFWQDYQIFRMRTEAVESLQRRIQKAKAKQDVQGPNGSQPK